jgi:hypothetical protein
MAASANAVAVLRAWNMIISFLILVVAAARFQIFSYSVKNATEVNPIAVFVRSIISK